MDLITLKMSQNFLELHTLLFKILFLQTALNNTVDILTYVTHFFHV